MKESMEYIIKRLRRSKNTNRVVNKVLVSTTRTDLTSEERNTIRANNKTF